MNNDANIQLAKSLRALNEAKTLLGLELTDGACNRAYYAMFSAAHAALWHEGVENTGNIIKTHNGLTTIFSKEIIRKGLLDVTFGQALNRVMNFRLLADYEGDQPSVEDATEAVRLAEVFVAKIEAVFFPLSKN